MFYARAHRRVFDMRRLQVEITAAKTTAMVAMADASVAATAAVRRRR